MNKAVPQRFDHVSRDHAEITVMRAVSIMGELISYQDASGGK
jgi:hypothetical protein